MKTWLYLMIINCFGITSCDKEKITYESKDLEISIETGANWIHDFPLFMGIKLKNPPQFAIWITDLDTNYIGTLYCTHKIAREGWAANGGNRRKEALPFWAYNRGVVESDGLYLPTKENPLVDGLTGATPKEDYHIKYTPAKNSTFLVWAEFNHSTDFNDYYPKSAEPGDPNYSGGKEGSGQPAVIYRAEVDLNAPVNEWPVNLCGHSSTGGSDGKLYPGTETLTTALSIVERIIIRRHE